MSFDIKVTRGRDLVDMVEVVDLHDGEVVLFWDCSPRVARRMAEALRADVRAGIPRDEFLERWSAAGPGDFG